MHVIPHIIPRAEHSISRTQIEQGVLDVLYALSKQGYEAYLVGGCVRDLLLGLEPKDFDIVTNATPDQVKGVFRGRCRIIGRRFRLAHVHAGDKVVEVATFRAQSQERGDRVIDAQGMLRRDNVYGSRDEDVWRRDFTINALYYNIEDFSIVDYVGAMQDLKAGLIRLIGEPVQRYREDPVRMIRAVRFACKLGLDLPQETAQPLPELSHLLAEAAPARLYEEVLKLFHGGQALCVFEKLRQHGLLGGLFDQTEYCLQQPDSWSALAIPVALGQTDERIANDKGVHPGFLFAVLMWEPMWQAMERDEQELVSLDELLKSANVVLAEQSERTALTRPIMQYVKEVWAMQLLLLTKQDQAQRVMSVPRFRASFDFLALRAVAVPRYSAVVEFWQLQQDEHPEWIYQPVFAAVAEEQESAFAEALEQTRRPQRRRRPRR